MSERAEAQYSRSSQRLLLLRHGEVISHQGDVPVTERGLVMASDVGRKLAVQTAGRMVVLSGDTLRTRQTAQAIAAGACRAGSPVDGPRVSCALRNPDLYIAGERVEMVSTAAAFASQVDGLDESGVTAIPFFRGFIEAADRIGWWLQHPEPPGEDAATVVRRVRAFAASLVDVGARAPEVTIGVTHSPVLRACAVSVLGEDPGELDWVAGLEVQVLPGGSVQMSWLNGCPSSAYVPHPETV